MPQALRHLCQTHLQSTGVTALNLVLRLGRVVGFGYWAETMNDATLLKGPTLEVAAWGPKLSKIAKPDWYTQEELLTYFVAPGPSRILFGARMGPEEADVP